jgi:hypothetical protein
MFILHSVAVEQGRLEKFPFLFSRQRITVHPFILCGDWPGAAFAGYLRGWPISAVAREPSKGK